MSAVPETTPLTIACLQMQPRFADKTWNLSRSLEMINQAADQGARLIVLPELCNTGYVFHSRQEAFALAEPLPQGPTVQAWLKVAAERGLFIVAGIAERDGEKLYNSAAVIGPEGYLGSFRKVHLWGDEHLFFEPGNLGFPVFHTPFGRLGVMICYDQWFPEAYRSCAVRGADIVCIPTNWVPIPGQRPDREAMANVLAMAAAHSNSFYVAAANRVGEERGQPFIGQSLIVSHTGWPVAGPASASEEAVLLASVNLSEARSARRWNDHNQVVRDRRPDQYDSSLSV
jgi:N-carbamoylputrescine amidase